jgi:ribokinase
VTYVTNFPKKGETIIGLSFEQKFGGKGANQAVILSRLGSQCGFCAMIGDDSYGDSYLNQLSREGVLLNGLSRTSAGPTGVACITVAEGGANMIVINPGANFLFTPQYVDQILPMYESATVLVCQNEIPPESTLRALQIGEKLGMLTIFNPAPISSDRESLWKSVLQADIVCPNETELYELLEGNFPIETEEQIIVAAHELLRRGVKVALVTLGSKGALVASKGGTEIISAPLVENCVDTVGAGDCFVGKLNAVT